MIVRSDEILEQPILLSNRRRGNFPPDIRDKLPTRTRRKAYSGDFTLQAYCFPSIEEATGVKSALSLSPAERLSGYAPFAARVIVGAIMAAHGGQKLADGPSNFGAVLGQLGVPLPTLTAYVVTFVELVGGVLLIVGMLSRLAALLLTVNLVAAISLVKVNVGLIAPPEAGAGAELDLALIAGFLVVLLAGPGKFALDGVLGMNAESGETRDSRSRRART
jgi:putative oxidoreductase